MYHQRLYLLLLWMAFAVNSNGQPGKKIHFQSILIDTHNDIPSTADPAMPRE